MTESNYQLQLAHGHSMVLVNDGAQQHLELLDTGGELMLRIRMTPHGPKVQIEASQLELTAKRTIDVHCERFSVHATEAVAMTSEGTMAFNAKKTVDMHAEQDVTITGALISLN